MPRPGFQPEPEPFRIPAPPKFAGAPDDWSSEVPAQVHDPDLGARQPSRPELRSVAASDDLAPANHDRPGRPVWRWSAMIVGLGLGLLLGFAVAMMRDQPAWVPVDVAPHPPGVEPAAMERLPTASPAVEEVPRPQRPAEPRSTPPHPQSETESENDVQRDSKLPVKGRLIPPPPSRKRKASRRREARAKSSSKSRSRRPKAIAAPESSTVEETSLVEGRPRTADQLPSVDDPLPGEGTPRAGPPEPPLPENDGAGAQTG